MLHRLADESLGDSAPKAAVGSELFLDGFSLSDRPPSNTAEAPDDPSKRICDCETSKPSTDPETGRVFCDNCGLELSRGSELVERQEFTPDVWREHRRLQERVRKFENYIASFQSLRCKEIIDGKECGRRIFKRRRGPAPKRCKDCQTRRNHEKLKAWRLKNPEAWRQIRERSEVKKERERQAITRLSAQSSR